MRTWKRILPAVAAVALTAVTAHAEAPSLTQEEPARFWRRAELERPIDVEAFDRPLLIAAVFHETNRRRVAEKLPRLHGGKALNEAADMQAAMMAVRMEVEHDNPLHGQHTPAERVRAAGLDPELVAENIAMTPVPVPPIAGEVYVRIEGGRRIFSAEPGGPEVRPHTYASFARAVLDQWMNSPGHRANILDPRLTRLGCGCRPGRTINGMDAIYAVQVFCMP